MTERATTPPEQTDPARAAAAARLPGRIAFLGFGLIGGSIALALRAAGYAGSFVAWTPQGRGPAEGLRRGLVDKAVASSAEAIDGADLIVLAGPPRAVMSLLGDKDLARAAGAGATVTDVASTKGAVVGTAQASGFPFVGGHPMAGREASGFAAATSDLFVDRVWVLSPGAYATAEDIDTVTDLVLATGARPLPLDPGKHDALVAGISHLPLVLSAALVETVVMSQKGRPSWPEARTLAASGWNDMTRLALGDPDMGGGILATNPEAVLDRLRAYRDAIDGWIAAIEDGSMSNRAQPPGRALSERLRAIRDALKAEP